jgi:hypothetical protein
MPAAQDVFERLFAGYAPEPNSGCWLWLRGLDGNGYANISVKRADKFSRAHRAHRLSWEFVNGPIPDDMCILHRCDVRSCVNPDHLFLGTRADNDADMRAKGRHSSPPLHAGEKNGQAKLTEGQVAEIRCRYQAGENWKILANEYGVNHRTIWKVGTNRSWRGDR